MTETIREKMRKRCEWIWNVSNFYYYFTIISLIIVVLFYVFAFFQSPSQFAVDFEGGSHFARSTSMRVTADFDSPALTLPINCGILNTEVSAKSIFLLLFGAGIVCMLPSIFIAWKLRTIFDSLDNEQTPFIRKNCKALAHISYTLILMGLISEMLPNIMLVIFGFSRHVRFALDFNRLFLGCIVLALSYFFEYGVVLQQESDELL